ncbi:MAG: iron transporter [Pseudomonadota bacterium]
MKTRVLSTLLACLSISVAHSDVLVGEELIQPGISFKLRVTDRMEMTPDEHQLAVEKADFALVAEANWSQDHEQSVPGNSPRGGFVPFLRIKVEIKNKTSGKISFVDLLPHLSMSRSMHYARNIILPDGVGDKYEVAVSVSPPDQSDLSMGEGWRGAHGARLFGVKQFKYGEVDLSRLRSESD